MSENLDLARRAVACRGWRWMPGMLVRTSASAMRIDGADVDGRPVRREDEGEGGGNECYAGWRSQEVLPDLTDPATRGCLLELTKEARRAPFGYVTCGRYRYADRDYAAAGLETNWVYWDTPEGPAFSTNSYEGALVAALEAAPHV